MVLVRGLFAGHASPPFHEGMDLYHMHITFPDEESGHKGTRTTSRTVQPPTFKNLRDTPSHLPFGIRGRSKEHHVSMESEDPKRGTVVIDILGREG